MPAQSATRGMLSSFDNTRLTLGFVGTLFQKFVLKTS
jgi:hypothetical protein